MANLVKGYPEETAELPPQSIESEQGLLGILLFENRYYDEISDIIAPHHFIEPTHGIIFQALRDGIESGQTVNYVKIWSLFPDLPKEYIAALTESFAAPCNCRVYAETIRDMSNRRQIIIAAREMIHRARQESSAEILSFAEKSFTEIESSKSAEGATIGQAVDEAIIWMNDLKTGKIKPIASGLEALDKKLGGFYGGRLYILAGRPGMGKTALALTIADNLAGNYPVLFLSLEMARAELAMRLIASRTGISVDRQQSPDAYELGDQQAINTAAADIRKQNIIIHDGGGADLTQIKTWARRFKRTKGKFLFVIDYLGLITMDRDIKNKVHQIEEITNALKALAKELDIPIMLLAQLSRGVEMRDDKRPMLSDLRDSGAIEQDADVVLLCYREDYYALKDEPRKGKKENGEAFQTRLDEHYAHLRAVQGQAEIIIAKNRQGKDGTAFVQFDGARQKFTGRT